MKAPSGLIETLGPASCKTRPFSSGKPCYICDMSKEQVKTILDRVLTWPIERQEDAAKILMLMESQDESGYRLTDEQVQEVKRRLADPNPKRLTLEEFNEQLGRQLGE